MPLQTCSADTFGCKWQLPCFLTFFFPFSFLLPKLWVLLASHWHICFTANSVHSCIGQSSVKRGGEQVKAHPAKWTDAGLRDNNESIPSAAFRKLMLLKEWGCRGRYPKTGAPFIDVWSLRFSAAFPPAYCLLVYLSYLSGPSEDRKITLEGSEETSSGPLPLPCVGLLITFS